MNQNFQIERLPQELDTIHVPDIHGPLCARCGGPCICGIFAPRVHNANPDVQSIDTELKLIPSEEYLGEINIEPQLAMQQA
jgi:hypothetical protein